MDLDLDLAFELKNENKISYDDMEKAKKTVEDFVLTYFPLHDLKLPEEYLKHWPIFSYVECCIYQLDELNESMSNQRISNEINQLSFIFNNKLNRLKEFFKNQNLWNEEIELKLKEGCEYWNLEREICHNLMNNEYNTINDNKLIHLTRQCIKRKSFDYRVLYRILLEIYKIDKDKELVEFLEIDEELIDIGDDLVDYEEDVISNSFNIYRAYIKIYKNDAQLKLIEYISELETERENKLKQLPINIQTIILNRVNKLSETKGSDKWIIPSPIYNEDLFKFRQKNI